jgi:hypothetical protein
MKATKHAPFPRRGVINKSVSVVGVSTLWVAGDGAV